MKALNRILFFVFFILISNVLYGQKKSHKLSKEERSKLTPDQQIAYENDRSRAKKKKHEDTTADKVKRAKKNDKKSRKISKTSKKYKTKKRP